MADTTVKDALKLFCRQTDTDSLIKNRPSATYFPPFQFPAVPATASCRATSARYASSIPQPQKSSSVCRSYSNCTTSGMQLRVTNGSIQAPCGIIRRHCRPILLTMCSLNFGRGGIGIFGSQKPGSKCGESSPVDIR